MNPAVRVRFAPSPTGPLHIGALRTALYNYLFARKHQGTFVLRIEDTDQKRLVSGTEDYIIRALQWCGIEPQEGPHRSGSFGPYRQSDRSEIYKEFIQILIAKDCAYFAFDTPEELDGHRTQAEEEGGSFSYGPANRARLSNSLSLPREEVEERISRGEPYVVRFKTPENAEIHCPDLIRGDVVYQSALLDDKVLFKSDGLPTYHLANVVDDHLMKITHVIRGEEWLPSLPLHILLYQSFGWTPPFFAHLPLILKPSGPGKLSKRDALKGNFPIFPLAWENNPGFRERGFLPSALNNILALLGWSPEGEQEVFTLEELVPEFDLSRVHKSGARFDPEKNSWFNQQHLQQLSPGVIARLIDESPGHYDMPKQWLDHRDYLEYCLGLISERLQLLTDAEGELRLFFEPPLEYDPRALKKAWKDQTPEILQAFSELIPEQFEPDSLKQLASDFVGERGLGMGALMAPLRLSLVGSLNGPDLFSIIYAIGREETIRRIGRALQMV